MPLGTQAQKSFLLFFAVPTAQEFLTRSLQQFGLSLTILCQVCTGAGTKVNQPILPAEFWGKKAVLPSSSTETLALATISNDLKKEDLQEFFRRCMHF